MTDFAPTYTGDSLYFSTPIGKRFMGFYVHRQIPPHPLDQYLIINNRAYHHRPDLFALDYYGHEDRFWVVPMRSGMQDLVFDFVYGAPIIVPDPSYIKDRF